MELSAEQFAEIVNQLNGVAPCAREGEHRRAPRVNRLARINIVPLRRDGKAQAPQVVQIKDISSRGLAFVRDAAMKPGAQFIVRLGRESAETVELLCTVVHCKSVSDEMFSIGAEFTCLAPAAQASNPAEQARISHSILN